MMPESPPMDFGKSIVNNPPAAVLSFQKSTSLTTPCPNQASDVRMMFSFAGRVGHRQLRVIGGCPGDSDKERPRQFVKSIREKRSVDFDASRSSNAYPTPLEPGFVPWPSPVTDVAKRTRQSVPA